MTVEVSWFGALCDDDYEFLGVPDPALASSWEHCRDITVQADRLGFDNILLPSGYALGIDAIAFAGGVAPLVRQMRLLTAVRMGEMWPPQLARQLATLDQMLNGRLTINIISSDLPGETLASAPRYQRTLEYMEAIRTLLNGEHLAIQGDFLNLDLDPPRIGTVSGKCPPMYFGGFSPAAKEVSVRAADVFLTWPDKVAAVGATIEEMTTRAEHHGRRLQYGLRAHVIVRETEAEAREAASRLVSRLDADTGSAVRGRSLDAASVGVQRQTELRDAADDEGYAEPNLWTGVGRARSGAGAAIVGDADQVLGKLKEYESVGVNAFILSGYPHLDECRLFARHVLGKLDHAPLAVL